MKRPFYWKARKAWYVKNERQNIRLHEDKKTAHEKWANMLSSQGSEIQSFTVSQLINEYIGSLENSLSSGVIEEPTFGRAMYYLQDIFPLHAKKLARELKPIHVTRWLNGHASWGVSSQRAAIGTIKTCLNWAVDQGILDRNPLEKMRKPAGNRREIIIDDDAHFRMLEATDGGIDQGADRKPTKRTAEKKKRRDGAFRSVLIALRHSGSRPGTICTVDVSDVDLSDQTWVVGNHKTKKKTGRSLTVHLSPCLLTLTRILMQDRTKGPLLRNTQGGRWKPDAIRCRFARMRQRLGLPAGTVAYSYRHSYTTESIKNGNDVATVAEMLGHRDLSMIQRHYGHLTGAKEHLKKAAARAIKPRN